LFITALSVPAPVGCTCFSQLSCAMATLWTAVSREHRGSTWGGIHCLGIRGNIRRNSGVVPSSVYPCLGVFALGKAELWHACSGPGFLLNTSPVVLDLCKEGAPAAASGIKVRVGDWALLFASTSKRSAGTGSFSHPGSGSDLWPFRCRCCGGSLSGFRVVRWGVTLSERLEVARCGSGSGHGVSRCGLSRSPLAQE
jgi:hypothetical protein